MTDNEDALLKTSQVLMRLATDSYILTLCTHEHYKINIGLLTNKSSKDIDKEFDELFPEQKAKAEEFIKSILKQYLTTSQNDELLNPKQS